MHEVAPLSCHEVLLMVHEQSFPSPSTLVRPWLMRCCAIEKLVGRLMDDNGYLKETSPPHTNKF